jgi:hypothetical protein
MTASAGFDPRTWVLKGSTLALDHRSRSSFTSRPLVRNGVADERVYTMVGMTCKLICSFGSVFVVRVKKF